MQTASMQAVPTWRLVVRRIHAIVLLVLVATVVVSIWVPFADVVAGMLVLLAGVFGVMILPRVQRAISLTLAIAGIVTLTWSLIQGVHFDLEWFSQLNQDIVALIAMVSFVRLVTVADEGTSRVTGWPAVIRTTLAFHVLSSILNLSAVTIVGDKLMRNGTLRTADSILLTRAFSSASFWSPFWVATVVALGFEPLAKTYVFLPIGAGVAAFVLAFTIAEVGRRLGPDLKDYVGYAFTWRLLRLPIALVAGVILGHLILPSASLAIIITVAIIIVVTVVIVFRKARRTGPPLSIMGHVESGFPVAEGTMFAGAGLLAIGLGAVLDTGLINLPITEYTVWTAWFQVIIVMVAALVGVHPIVSLAAAGSIFGGLDVNPTLFALGAVLSWGASVGTGPVSGLNIYLSARYGTSNLRTTRLNIPYVIVVVILSLPALWFCNLITS